MSEKHVFYDATQRRRKLLSRITLVFGALIAALAALFILSVLLMPFLPQISYGMKQRPKSLPVLSHHQKHLQKFILSRERAELYAWIAKEQKYNGKNVPVSKTSPEIVAAFYTVWQKNGLNSLRANADNITHLLPEWLHLGADGKTIVFNDWSPDLEPNNREVERIARDNRIRIMPVLNNAAAGEFDSRRAHLLLSETANRKALILQLKAWLKQNRYQGVNVDFENVDTADVGSYCLFLKELEKEFADANLAVSADIAAGSTEMPWREIASSCDFVILMAYDEHSAHNPAGPIASISWYNKILRKALNLIPPEKLVLGLANYAYDWKENSKSAEAMTFQHALIVAQDNMPGEPASKIIDFDPAALNPTFTYEDEAGAGHEVWMLDAVTAANQWHVAQNFHIGGAALWVMGSEDPSLWNFFGKGMTRQEFSVTDLQTMKFPYDVEFIGEGEILKVKTSPKEGSRTIEIDEETELAVDEKFTQFPASFVIGRTGYKPRTVALTFDDGPSKPYTEEVLAELKKENIRATFFLIGENADRFPELVERIWEEGHEIGNHTYTHANIGEASERRAVLEINSTERVIQSIIGRSTILFRPPYNADAEPSSAEEVKTLITASGLGYFTVGEFIDPQDWNPSVRLPDNTLRKHTAQDIADDVINRIQEGHGNTVLLHDGGGDRSLTVESLKILIPELKREGYSFVTISGILGVPRDSVMPRVRKDDRMLVNAARIVFELDYFGSIILRTAFIVAICLGIAKLCLMLFLAFVQKRKEKDGVFSASFTPSVSVIIPAYNEQKVIVSTVNAVRNNRYAPLDIIIVDDGSTDGTADVVEHRFKATAGIRFLRQENSGKASALNAGLRQATGEIIVCLDADTVLAADAIQKLVRHFENPKVGAVAGNVKVGNRINLLTYWQAIEYITSQNLDRRAFDLLNAVPVIPGAAGAWRRSAVMDAGGYKTDTLAEDMDLTWRIRKAGYVLKNEPEALGFTEAPDTLKGLFTQRFRWTFGTLQCLWKHRDALWRYRWFGTLMLPSMWVFQILFQILAPLIDLQIFVSLLAVFVTWLSHGIFWQDWQPYAQATNVLIHFGIPYFIFCIVDLAGSFSAFTMEREDKKLLPWIMVQKFVYRQLMYAVVFKSVRTAFTGIRKGWGKIERKGFAA